MTEFLVGLAKENPLFPIFVGIAIIVFAYLLGSTFLCLARSFGAARIASAVGKRSKAQGKGKRPQSEESREETNEEDEEDDPPDITIRW